jgi:glycosyltransferase involved in cell wall biosynthesis
MRRAKGIIVPNEFLQREISHRHGIIPAIVRNPCESDSVEEKERENLALSNGKCSITYTGAIYDVNFGAFRNLLAALEHPGADGTTVHLYTAQPLHFLEGAGINGPKIIYHQHVPPEEVVTAQNSADILFIPFAFDSLIPEVINTSAPGKLGDYLASGTPILAHVPPDSFVSWYLKTHNCGLVVDEDDHEALSLAVQRLSNDMELRRTLSRNARRRAREDFTPETAMRSFLSALEMHQ